MPLAYISSISVDPYQPSSGADHPTVFVVGDAMKFGGIVKGGDRAILRLDHTVGGTARYLAGGSHGDGVWYPTRYPATGSTGMAVLYMTPAEASGLGQCPPAVPVEAPTAYPGTDAGGSLCEAFVGGLPDASPYSSLWDTSKLFPILSGLSAPRQCFSEDSSSAVSPTCGAYESGGSQFTFKAGGDPTARSLETKPLDCSQGCSLRFALKFGSPDTAAAGCPPQSTFGSGVSLFEVGGEFPNKWRKINSWDAQASGGAWQDGLESNTVYGPEVRFRLRQAGSLFADGEDMFAIANVCVLVGGSDCGCTCVAPAQGAPERACCLSENNPITHSACTCEGEADCGVGKYCYDGACREQAKPNACVPSDELPVTETVGSCRCKTSQVQDGEVVNECLVGQYCHTADNVCRSSPALPYTDCASDDVNAITQSDGPCRCNNIPGSGNRVNECVAGSFCLSSRVCSATAAPVFSFCGNPVSPSTMPDDTLLFYEHDNGGNNLDRVVVDRPNRAETVMGGGHMILSPSPDFVRGALYTFVRTTRDDYQDTGEDNVMIKRLWWATGLTEVVFSAPASDFAFLTQAPTQLPAAFDANSQTWFWFMKSTSVRGAIYKLDVSSTRNATITLPLSMADAVRVYEDECSESMPCLVPGALYHVNMHVDCAGALWFNEGGAERRTLHELGRRRPYPGRICDANGRDI